MNPIKYLISCIVLLLLSTLNSALANSYTVDSVPNPYRQSEVIYVIDPDHILSATDITTINQRLTSLEQKTTIETAVVALPSIGQMDTREFANKLFNHWQIGKKDKDNGLLILLVLDQREVVFEVGYGLEGNLTDAKSYRLMDQYMLPLFKQNQFSQGMVTGVDGVAAYLEQQFADGTLYSMGSNPSSMMSLLNINSPGDLGIIPYGAIIFVILLVIYCFWGDRIFMIRNWATAKYVSPFGRLKKALLLTWVSTIILMIFSGIFGFGQYASNIFGVFIINSVLLVAIVICGGIFSVFKLLICKGITLLFKKQFQPKQKKLICPTCRQRSIVELTEHKESRLNKDEQYLMGIGAVTYRLFDCDQGSCHATFKGSKINIGWKTCPHCQLPTNHLINSTRVEPTYSQSGLLTQYYRCVKCQTESVETKTLPRKQRSSSSGGSSSGGSGGGSSRGGGSSGGGGSRGRF